MRRTRATKPPTTQSNGRGAASTHRKQRTPEAQPAAPAAPPPRLQPELPRGSDNPHRLGRPRGAMPEGARLYGDDVEAVRAFIRNAIRQSATFEQVAVSMATRLPPVTRSQAKRYWDDVASEMKRELDGQLINARAVQVQQIEFEIAEMRGMTPIPRAHLERHRRLLAEITGTRAPIKVGLDVNIDVRLRSAVMQVVGGMSAEEFERLADSVIETTGTAAE